MPRAGGGLLEGLTRDGPDQAVSSEEVCTQKPIRFADVGAARGVDYTFLNQIEAGRRLMPEATGGAGGWVDYDGDGRPDLFFPQGGDPAPPEVGPQPSDVLLRNGADGQFRDVSVQAGVSDRAFGHGVTAGDFDGDGFDDLYVGNVGEDVLLQNLGDGTYRPVPAESGIANPAWASSGAFGDLNGDGHLDLFVCNYVDYDPRYPVLCKNEDGDPATCHPAGVGPYPNVCFISNGDGTFTERLLDLGLDGPGSKSLGVVVADVTGDGRLDVFVANDTTANHLFRAGEDGRFSEEGGMVGLAGSGLGQYQASMGVAFGDYDRNGWFDFYVTHFADDSNTLYRGIGEAGFSDATRGEGLHEPTLPLLGFGTVMADFNTDGRADLFVANGHIDDWRDRFGDEYQMRAQLFRYDGRRWHECVHGAGDYFEKLRLGRAVATADFDRDGDTDLIVVNQNDPAALLENTSERGHWLRIRPLGIKATRTPVGVLVEVQQGEDRQVAQLAGGTSYCSAHELVLEFGLGDSAEPCEVTLRWPGGAVQTLTAVSVDQHLTVVERADRTTDAADDQ